MGSYRLYATKRFLRHLKRLDGEAWKRVLEAIGEIIRRPYIGSTFLFEERRLYKYRVGAYRIIYEVDEDEKSVLFFMVGHRRRVYREFKI